MHLGRARRRVAVALVLSACPAIAIEPPPRPEGAIVRSFQAYGPDQGLGNLSTMSLLQSRDLWLWVATQEGLYRYDGERFRGWGRAEGLPAALLFDLAEDGRGNLWVATLKGLARQVEERFEPVDLPDSPPGEAVEAVTTDRDGSVLAAAVGGVWRCQHAACERIFEVPATEFASAVAVDPASGDLWFGGSFGVVQWRGGELRRFSGGTGGISNNIRHLLVGPGGEVWLRTADGLAHLESGGDEFRSVPGVPPAADGSRMVLDRQGTLWIPSDQGLASLAAGRLELWTAAHGLPAAATAAVIEDHEGSLWIALAYAGVARWLGRGRFEAWTPATGLPGETVWAIERLADGTLAFGTQHGLGLLPPAGGELRELGRREGLPGEFVLALRAAPAGGLWITTAEGGFALREATGRMIDLLPGDWAGGRTSFLAMATAPDGTLYLGATTGLFAATGPPERPVLRRIELPRAQEPSNERPLAEMVADVTVDREGRVLAAGRYGLAVLARDGSRRIGRADGLRDEHLSSVAVAADGEIWVAYRDALGVSALTAPLDGPVRARHFGSEQGLRHDLATFVRADDLGRIWVGTTRGLSVRWGDRFTSFGRAQGLLSDDSCSNAALAEPGGAFWIGTPRGAIRATLAAEDLVPPAPPEVRWVEARLGGRPIEPGRPAVARYEQRGFEARFAALTFRHEREVELRSELVGHPETVSLGPAREARFPLLPAGSYVFSVAARVPGGEFGAPALLAFEIRPPWWAAPPARLAVALLVLAVAIAGDRWRQGRARRERDRLEAAVVARTRELAASREELAAKNQELATLATTDPLTGLYNRRFTADFLDGDLPRIRREWRDAASGETAPARLVFFLLDLDGFKFVNDRHGHEVGDRVLVEAGRRLRLAVRGSDLVARWGGEEFLVIARDLPEAEWEHYARRLREALSDQPFVPVPGAVSLRCTASLGYAGYPFGARLDASWEQVLRLADLALFAVKKSGRDAHLGIYADAAAAPESLGSDLSALAATGGVRLSWSESGRSLGD